MMFSRFGRRDRGGNSPPAIDEGRTSSEVRAPKDIVQRQGVTVDAEELTDTPQPPPPASPTRSNALDLIHDEVLSRIEPSLAVQLSQAELMRRVEKMIDEIANERSFLINQSEQNSLTEEIVQNMVGLGPLQPLLNDPNLSDILVNGAKQIYVERRGRLELVALHFRNDAHVLHIAQRIASSIGRRIDESSPMLDARLADGSRVNVIIPPLSIRGPCVSIRKFARSTIDFPRMVELGTMSPRLVRAMEICARCRINIIISGGTGSGKTTLLNALSKKIDTGERIITIEDTAELQLQQPHVVQLETRPPNVEGHGEINPRDLVRNALRMRPDRIIVGEVRGPEAFDMLQAMNTGHNGSMSTIHANSARDGLVRIENMVLMSEVNLPSRAIRAQIASAIDLVIHLERMRDGVRRIMDVSEIVGMESDTITMNPLFTYQYEGENPDGSLRGSYVASGIRPRFLPKAEYFGLADSLIASITPEPRGAS
jgi:pilus assembly protein CpaF